MHSKELWCKDNYYFCGCKFYSMEYTWYRDPIETFDDVIQELTDFKNCALNLSNRYEGILYYDSIAFNTIEDKLQRHLKNPQNKQTLQKYVDVLRRFTDKKIKEALPDGSMEDSIVMCFTEEEIRQEEERMRQKIKESINGMIVFITKVLSRHSATSVKTIYLDNHNKPKIHLKKVIAFETALLNANLIEPTPDFALIFRGQAPNRRINWIGTNASFTFLIKRLFEKEHFVHLNNKWIIASNTFTTKGNPLPSNIHRNNEIRDVNELTKRIINDAISRLTD